MYMIYSEGFLFNVSFAMRDSAWALLCSDKVLRKRFANEADEVEDYDNYKSLLELFEVANCCA